MYETEKEVSMIPHTDVHWLHAPRLPLRSDTHICIHDVWTDPDMRRCGYARLLLTELIQDWKNDSLNNSHDNTIIPLILHVSGSNMPAVSLYKSSGFVVREELKYYNVK